MLLWVGLVPCSFCKSGWYTLEHFWLRAFAKLKLLELKWKDISQKFCICMKLFCHFVQLSNCMLRNCMRGTMGEWPVTKVRKAMNVSSYECYESCECSWSLFGNLGSFFPLAERCSELGCSLGMICSKVKDSSEVVLLEFAPAWFLNYLINPLYWNMLHRQWVQYSGRMKVAVTVIFYLILY